GRQALSGGGDAKVRLWDAATANPIRTMTGHTSPVQGVALSPNGRNALSGSADGVLMVWDVGSGLALHRLEVPLHPALVVAAALSSGWTGAGVLGRPKGVGVTHVAFSADGSRAACGCEDGTVHLWETATAEYQGCLLLGKERVTSVAFSPKGNRLVAAG